MPFFSYRARSTSGKILNGEIEAANTLAVAQKLDEQGFIPIRIEEKKDFFKATGFSIPLLPKLGLPKERDLIVFTRQISAMLGAGVPLVIALGDLEKQTTNKYFKKSIREIRTEIERGSSLSNALKNHKDVFSEIYTEMIVIGEVSGTLKEILDRLAILLEYQEATRTKVVMATRYPVIVLCAISMAVIFLLSFVVPKFVGLFSQINARLPLPTIILMHVGLFFNKFWYLLLFSILGLFYGFQFYRKTPAGRHQIDMITLKTPVFGGLLTKIIIARFAQTLAILNRSGIPLNFALLIIGRTLGNSIFENALKRVQDNLVAGRGFSEPLRTTGLFPPMVIQMISIGEESGELAIMLDRIVDYYELEIDYTIKNLVTLIEPMLIAVLAVVVLVIALGIFLPMWNIMEIYGKGGGG